MKIYLLGLLLAIVPYLQAAESNVAVRGYAVVPLHLSGMNRLGISTLVNGQKVEFLLDTGCTLSSIHKDVAQRLHLSAPPASLHIPAQISANGRKVDTVWLEDFRAGQMNFGARPMLTLETREDMDRSYKGVSGRLLGLLGLDLLVSHKAILNCQTQQIYFKTDAKTSTDIGPALLRAGYKSVPMRVKSGQLLIPCKMRGREFFVVLDTGSSMTALKKNMVDSLGLKSYWTSMKLQIIYGKLRNVNLIEPKEHDLEIAGLPIAMPLGALHEEIMYRHLDGSILGIVGGDILGNCGAVLDFEKEKAWFRPPAVKK